MTPHETFVRFTAMKMHFNNPKYDALKYNFKVNASPSSFNNRRDKWFYHKLSNKQDVDGLIISNLLEKPDLWVGELFEPSGEEIYNEWAKRQQSLTYMFSGEIKRLDDDFNSNFISDNGQHPHLLTLHRRKKISIETMVILNDILNFVPKWNKTINDSVVWPKICLSLTKYKPFINYDAQKCKKILRDHFVN